MQNNILYSLLAVIEQRKQAQLNIMVENAAAAAEHRSKNKIVERIYSDVKGLKSVLRKSRRGTKYAHFHRIVAPSPEQISAYF